MQASSCALPDPHLCFKRLFPNFDDVLSRCGGHSDLAVSSLAGLLTQDEITVQLNLRGIAHSGPAPMSSGTGGGGTAGNSGNAAAANKFATALSPLRGGQKERTPLRDIGKSRKEKVAEAVAELRKDADLVDALNDAISHLCFSPVRPIAARGAGSTPSSQNTRKPPSETKTTPTKTDDMTGVASDAVDSLAAATASVALAPRSISALEREVESTEQKLVSMKIELEQLMAAARSPAPPARGDFKCFGCIIFLPHPSTALERTWKDCESLNVPHIMLVVDYCSGDLKSAGGFSRPGESEVECMNREFFEETGYKHPICRFRPDDLRSRSHGRAQGRPVQTCTFVKYATMHDLDALRRTPPFSIPCIGETAAVAFLPLAPSASSIEKSSQQHVRPFPGTCLRTMAQVPFPEDMRYDNAVGLKLKIVNMLHDFPEFDSLYASPHAAAAAPSDAPPYAKHFLTWLSLEMQKETNSIPESQSSIFRSSWNRQLKTGTRDAVPRLDDWFYRRLFFEDARCEFVPPPSPCADFIAALPVSSLGDKRSELEKAVGGPAAYDRSRGNGGDSWSRSDAEGSSSRRKDRELSNRGAHADRGSYVGRWGAGVEAFRNRDVAYSQRDAGSYLPPRDGGGGSYLPPRDGGGHRGH
jgi:ADP-ribose pyrophosphatase YjhB (NUDIX family)